MTHNIGDYKTVGSFDASYDLHQFDSDVYATLDSVGLSHLAEEYSHLLVKLDESQADYSEVWGIDGTPYIYSSAELLYSQRQQAIDQAVSHLYYAIGELCKTPRFPKNRATFTRRVLSWITANKPNIEPYRADHYAIIVAFNARWINCAALDWNGVERHSIYITR